MSTSKRTQARPKTFLHRVKGRVTPGWESITDSPEAHRLIRIRSGKNAPETPFVAVNYRNNCFWIDDRDLRTKRTFAFMLMLFTLADTGEKENVPLVTIPAQ